MGGRWFFLCGGHFIVPSYKLYVDFGRCNGVVDIIWLPKTDFHATLTSSIQEGFTHVGTSAQIAQDLVNRVQSLVLLQKSGNDVNKKIHGVKDIVEQKKDKTKQKIGRM